MDQRNCIKFCEKNEIKCATDVWNVDCVDSSPVMTFLSKFGSPLNVINISWAITMRCCFCLKFSNFATTFDAACFMLKTSGQIAWHEPYDMSTSLATSLIVIRGLSKINFFTASMFSSVVDVFGRPGEVSSLKSSRPSLNRLYYNWTCVVLIVDSPNATVNISNIRCTFNFHFLRKT